MIFKLGLLFIFLYAAGGSTESVQNDNKEAFGFAIDYKNDQFLLDGKPFRYVAGSFHYFRAPQAHWRDILRKMRAAGLNAVDTYVEWSMHEPLPGKWVWDGDADLEEFISMAQEEDLLVILRPGPYICAERDFGGLPFWLLNLVPDIKLRTNDQRYIFYATRFIDQVFKKVKHHLRGHGGPIIMVQVENEYGSFYSCNDDYKMKIYDVFKYHVGNKAVLFTTDGPEKRMLQCGSIPGIYSTIDFGNGANVDNNIKMMRQYSPKGPLVNSEYYPGWLSHWNETFHRIRTPGVVKTLDEMLYKNFSVNMYMFYGGTNFGFTSGANMGEYYSPQLTSYDYDAPLTEAGDPTKKYHEIKRVISKYLPIPHLGTPLESPKGDYGRIVLRPKLDLFSKEGRSIFGTEQAEYIKPPSFEALGLSNWLVLYETDVPIVENTRNLTLEAIVKDRALVYTDDKLTGVLSRMNKKYVMRIPGKARKLKLLVENQGRINYGSSDVEDFKGLMIAKLNGVALGPWKVIGFPLSSVFDVSMLKTSSLEETSKLLYGPQFFVGFFQIEDQPLSTYLNTVGWGKGVAYVNGHNLGRYWPATGPQVTLYVPAAYLRNGINTLVVLELESVPENRSMQFQTEPILDYSLEAAKMHYKRVWDINVSN